VFGEEEGARNYFIKGLFSESWDERWNRNQVCNTFFFTDMIWENLENIWNFYRG